MAGRTKIEAALNGRVSEITHHESLKQVKIQVHGGPKDGTVANLYLPDEHLRNVIAGDIVKIMVFVEEPPENAT